MGSAVIRKASLALLVAIITSTNCSIPEYISVCPSNHQNLSACIISSIEELRPRLRVGIDELEVPAMDPLHLGEIIIDKIANGSRLTTNVTDIVVYGASEFQILKLTRTIRKRGYTFRFEVIIPKLHIEGKYELDSQILFLDLVGKGPFNANISRYKGTLVKYGDNSLVLGDYHFECILKGNKIRQGDDIYLQYEKMKYNSVIGKSSILLENLFNGNQVFGRAVNDIINDNIDLFHAEVGPGLREGIASKLTQIANKITLAFKYEELFPEV